MQATPHIRWIRPARQARSQETQDRLLDSAEALIGEKGFDDVSVAEIAGHAGFSVGAVYSRFRDKDALLQCLQERFADEVRATADTAFDPASWEGTGIAEIAREGATFSVQIHRERSGLLREVLSRAHGDPETAERVELLVAFVARRLRVLLLERAHEIRHPEPEVAVDFVGRLLLGILKEAILFGGPGTYGIPSSDERLAAELTRAFLGYLGVRSPDARGAPPADPRGDPA